MEKEEQISFLIRELLKEDNKYKNVKIPEKDSDKHILLRSLMNVRPPRPLSEKLLKVQNEILTAQTNLKGIVDSSTLPAVPTNSKISVWQGDITRLKADAIVNAANNQLLGCFIPCHGCIDNAIHSAAGIQLRLECNEIMQKQGYSEPTGKAKITKAYNLPCRYIIHTVGPIVDGCLTENHKNLLQDCYRNCLELASDYELASIAFCCISTGEFHFPQKSAAEIAVETVNEFLRYNTEIEKVVFNVYKQDDYDIYRELLE